MSELRDGTAEEAGLDPRGVALIRERAAEWVMRPATHGLVTLVARHGVVCLEEAFGRRSDQPDAPPMTTDSIFMLASMAKPVTAAAALILVEDGLLGLTRPLKHYIPELTGAGSDEVLVQHLLVHTAGYSDDATLEYVLRYVFAGEHDIPPAPEGVQPEVHNTLQALYTVPITRPPGSVMAYGNNHYVLLAEVIRRVSGQPIEVFAKERIFDPLGMPDSAYGYSESMAPRLAEQDLGVLLGETPLPVDVIKQYIWFSANGGGGLFGTARDYARFAQMLLQGGVLDGQRILSPASVEQMATNQIPGVPVDFHGWPTDGVWGLGLMLQGNERWRWADGALTPIGTAYHGGYGGSAFWIDCDHDVLGVFLSLNCEMDRERHEIHWDYDLFQNLVTAAVTDPT